MIQFLWEWLRYYKIHLVFWVIYIMYESGLTGVFAGRFGKAENYIVHYTLNISLFYFHYWMMKKFAKRRFYILAVTLQIIVEILIYIPLLAILNHFFTDYNQASIKELFGINEKFIASAIYRSIFFIIVSTGYWFLRQYINERKKAEEIERDRLQQIVEKEIAEKNLLLAQNAYLRAQVNPHFLFNTLSFVHRRIRKSDSIAGDVIVALTSLMRYAVETSQDTEKVLLNEELTQVYDLISILKTLKGTEFNFQIEVESGFEHIMLIPLLLLTIVENMYKHGDLSNANNPGVLKIAILNNTLIITTKNLISKKKKSLSLGTGLTNLQKRLADHNGLNGNMSYKEIDNEFLVAIIIPIQERG